MKIVFSSTVEQEQEIENLISMFYHSSFPQFFTEDEILHFQEIGVLQANKDDFSYNGTLRVSLSSDYLFTSNDVPYLRRK